MRTKLAVALALIALPLFAVDYEYVAAWEAAQKRQPAHPPHTARIAPVNEPGTPLTIRGRVADAAGHAIRDAVVFAYHTDATGVYDRPGTPAHSWRLYGWATTDARGTFVFETIRPAPYPNRNVPAHVHFTVVRSNGQRYFANDLEFEEGKAAPAADVTLKLDEKNRF
ncbi:MAG TPA: hypothetical protein VF787_19065 [Thermoanaerobaculia bacterium]